MSKSIAVSYTHLDVYKRQAYYIKCMAMAPEVPDEVWSKITKKNLEDINDYIAAKMTATWFSEEKNSPPNREIITNELMYYLSLIHI